jgi:hypothetical protein
MKKNIQIVNVEYKQPDVGSGGSHGGIAAMLSRFFPMFDKNVKKFLTIEADNWPTEAYFNIINQWASTDKLCLTFTSSGPYGWPSGDKMNINGIDQVVHFRQNYGGMFGLSKPDGKFIYNTKFYDLLINYARQRKEIFNKNYFDSAGNALFPGHFYGLIGKKIDYILDFGIDEVWLSVFILPKVTLYDKKSIVAIPIADVINFDLLPPTEKEIIINKLKMKLDLKDLTDSQGLFNYINDGNKNISTALEIASVEEALDVGDYGLGVDKKYRDSFMPTFKNVYPGWDYSLNYTQLKNTLNSIKNKTVNVDYKDGSFMLFQKKYLKYKQKYLVLKNKQI